MSRRKLLWKNRIRQAGSVEKTFVNGAVGRGEWLTKSDLDGTKRPSPGTGAGNVVSRPMTDRKMGLVKSWSK